MKQSILAALALLSLAAPSHAQMSQASCDVSWGLISTLMTLPQDVAPSLEGEACVARDLEVVNGRVRILVDRVSWDLDGLEALLATGTLLNRAEIQARGVYVTGATGMPDFDYILEAQARASEGISVDLLATYSDDQLRLDHLHVDFPGENAVDATLLLDNVDPRHPEAAVLSDLRLEVLTRGLFESYALMPLGNLLLGSTDDPEERVADLQAQAIQMIGTLPDPLFGTLTRQALTMLVEDMPNPAGRVTLDLHYADGLPVALLEPFGPAPLGDPMAMLQEADLQIGYDRYEAE